MKINTYQNCKNPTVMSTIDVDFLLDEIGSGRRYGEHIQYARHCGKGSEMFDLVKEKHIPTYTTNATFNEKRHGKNYQDSTGMLYIDVDGTTDVDVSHELVYASWKSVSGTGRGMMVQVEGLTAENIKGAYRTVSTLLGVKDKNADYRCGEVTRQTVLSYDPDIYINDSSIAINVGDLDLENGKIPPINPHEKKERKICTFNGGISNLTQFSNEIKYDNTHLVDLDGKPYQYYEDKIGCSKLFIPRTIAQGKRYSTLMALLTQFVALNPKVSNSQIYYFGLSINNRCDVPLKQPELYNITAEIIKRREEGSIEPIINMPRTVIIDPNLPKKEKQKICGMASGRVRAKKSVDKLTECLQDWDLNTGKVTNRTLATAAKMNIKTVEKHTAKNLHLKQMKKEINRQIATKLLI